MLGYNWARNFTVTSEDIEFLTNLLLEKETPMRTEDLARILVKDRLEAERAALEARYAGTQPYNPSHRYQVGDRLVFSRLDYATATVQKVRAGVNKDHGDFSVIAVDFDDTTLNADGQPREYAAELQTAHVLSEENGDENTAYGEQQFTVDEILKASRGIIYGKLNMSLQRNDSLIRVAGFWFPKELVLEIDIGPLHLAEAVLDMAGGGPLSTYDILDQIGGVGDAPRALQVFSMNLAMRDDKRFDEVGPAGEVLWFLRRMMPQTVREIPPILNYREIPYSDDTLTEEMFDLETELDDELTDIEFEGELQRATTTLIYPHRRAGTLPLNAKTRQIFPYARTPRIYVEFIDADSEETFTGWVVHDFKYVYGLTDYYTKNRLPVGAYITLEKGENEGQIIISYDGYKPRTEWIRVLTPNNDQIQFENKKRAIGASYDDLVIVGVDDLEAVDKLVQTNNKRSLTALLRDIIRSLSQMSHQDTVHAVTIYSVVNVLRRCPPGPIFATLNANPDFEHVGDHYWRLSN